MDLLEKIDLYIGEEVVSGGVATTTGDVAKYPESTKFGRRKKKKKDDEADKV